MATTGCCRRSVFCWRYWAATQWAMVWEACQWLKASWTIVRAVSGRRQRPSNRGNDSETPRVDAAGVAAAATTGLDDELLGLWLLPLLFEVGDAIVWCCAVLYCTVLETDGLTEITTSHSIILAQNQSILLRLFFFVAFLPINSSRYDVCSPTKDKGIMMGWLLVGFWLVVLN